MNKFIGFVLGILLIILGIVPLLQSQNISLGFFPEENMIYQIITIIIGALIIFFSFRRKYMKIRAK